MLIKPMVFVTSHLSDWLLCLPMQICPLLASWRLEDILVIVSPYIRSCNNGLISIAVRIGHIPVLLPTNYQALSSPQKPMNCNEHKSICSKMVYYIYTIINIWLLKQLDLHITTTRLSYALALNANIDTAHKYIADYLLCGFKLKLLFIISYLWMYSMDRLTCYLCPLTSPYGL